MAVEAGRADAPAGLVGEAAVVERNTTQHRPSTRLLCLFPYVFLLLTDAIRLISSRAMCPRANHARHEVADSMRDFVLFPGLRTTRREGKQAEEDRKQTGKQNRETGKLVASACFSRATWLSRPLADTLGKIRVLAFDFSEARTQGHVAQMQCGRRLLPITATILQRLYDLFVCWTIC